jgi:hypothetical protein
MWYLLLNQKLPVISYVAELWKCMELFTTGRHARILRIHPSCDIMISNKLRTDDSMTA